MNKYGFEPDFENLKTVLMGKKGYRVPNMELVIDREIKEGFLGKPVICLEDDIEFRYQAGYDYVWISIGMIDPAGTVNKELVKDLDEKHFAGKDKRVWADEHGGIIFNERDIDNFPWPEVEKMDFLTFTNAGKYLKPGMKVIAVLGKIFTAAWQLMGFQKFCELMYENPKLVKELTNRIGHIQVEVLKRIIGIDTLGAVWIPDDIAYRSGPMIRPDWFKNNIFPYYKTMADICREADKPIIYHSDGDLTKMLDIILDTGFHALHPIEPESMDIYAVRKRVQKKICLVGNIRVHTLATGTPDEIRSLVKDRIVNLGYDGAYCVGSSNSVPNFVPLYNYKTMLQTSADFGFINKEGY